MVPINILIFFYYMVFFYLMNWFVIYCRYFFLFIIPIIILIQVF